jgi:aminoglycoside 6'-N-acetyltransferase
VALRLRPLADQDLVRLAGWLAAPHVAPWWREPSDLASVRAAYRPLVDGTDPTEGLVVEVDGEPVGFAQRYRVAADPGWCRAVTVGVGPVAARSVGIDYLIGEEPWTGRGLGRTLIADLVAGTWSGYPEAAAVLVAVDQGNHRSWRALQAAGLRRVWAGRLDSDDPSDAGPSYLYRVDRPGPAGTVGAQPAPR